MDSGSERQRDDADEDDGQWQGMQQFMVDCVVQEKGKKKISVMEPETERQSSRRRKVPT